MLPVPLKLRLLLARDARALTAVGRIFVQEIFRWQRERAALRLGCALRRLWPPANWGVLGVAGHCPPLSLVESSLW